MHAVIRRRAPWREWLVAVAVAVGGCLSHPGRPESWGQTGSRADGNPKALSQQLTSSSEAPSSNNPTTFPSSATSWQTNNQYRQTFHIQQQHKDTSVILTSTIFWIKSLRIIHGSVSLWALWQSPCLSDVYLAIDSHPELWSTRMSSKTVSCIGRDYLKSFYIYNFFAILFDLIKIRISAENSNDFFVCLFVFPIQDLMLLWLAFDIAEDDLRLLLLLPPPPKCWDQRPMITPPGI